jgi:iron-sulfur cluster assembly protein
MSITLTDAATEKVTELITTNAEKKGITPESLFLRVYIAGGGCGGVQFGMALTDQKRDDDILVEYPGITLVVDPMSNTYLEGASVDFINHELGSRFKIDAPQAQSSAGGCSAGGCSGCG